MKDMEGKPADFTVYVEHETELALLCVFGDRQVWLPKSQISYADSCCGVKETTISISVPSWLVKKYGL